MGGTTVCGNQNLLNNLEETYKKKFAILSSLMVQFVR